MEEYMNLAEKQPEKRSHSVLECVLSWICLLAGYLFCRLFPASESPLGSLCFLWGLYLLAFIVLRLKGQKFAFLPCAAAASGMIAAWIPVVSADWLLSFISFAYSLAALGYFIYAAFGNALRPNFCTLIFMDFFKALLIAPFFATGEFFRAMFSGKFGRKFSLRVLIGIFIAILPTAVVVGLLSYDNGFMDLWLRMFDIDILPHIGSVILGIPLGMYLFGAFLSSADRMADDLITAENCEKTSETIKFAPVITVLAAALPILFVYAVFFISQWKYYISGFTGILPEGFSYAQYAREGFFQLCSVSVINLCVTSAIVLFMTNKSVAESSIRKVLCILFSVFTLILIATALAKMQMYIRQYGLTQKRVLSSWLMIVLGVIFVLISIGQFWSKLQVGAVSLAVTVVAFIILGLFNVNGMIAKYNLDLYSSGQLVTPDLETIYELGDAGVPHLVNFANWLEAKTDLSETDKNYYEKLDQRLSAMYKDSTADTDLFQISIPKMKAQKALRQRYGN